MQHPDLIEIIRSLKSPFPMEYLRVAIDLDGNQRLYIPFATLCDRVNTVAPRNITTYNLPRYVGDFCMIICTIEIGAVLRQGVGNALIQLPPGVVGDFYQGTAIERAVKDAYKKAADQWGVGRSLNLGGF